MGRVMTFVALAMAVLLAMCTTSAARLQALYSCASSTTDRPWRNKSLVPNGVINFRNCTFTGDNVTSTGVCKGTCNKGYIGNVTVNCTDNVWGAPVGSCNPDPNVACYGLPLNDTAFPSSCAMHQTGFVCQSLDGFCSRCNRGKWGAAYRCPEPKHALYACASSATNRPWRNNSLIPNGLVDFLNCTFTGDNVTSTGVCQGTCNKGYVGVVTVGCTNNTWEAPVGSCSPYKTCYGLPAGGAAVFPRVCSMKKTGFVCQSIEGTTCSKCNDHGKWDPVTACDVIPEDPEPPLRR